jgi:hypothetical protein
MIAPNKESIALSTRPSTTSKTIKKDSIWRSMKKEPTKLQKFNKMGANLQYESKVLISSFWTSNKFQLTVESFILHATTKIKSGS